jgi:glycine/D-amino acid oxidase-like deaminating enzyme
MVRPYQCCSYGRDMNSAANAGASLWSNDSAAVRPIRRSDHLLPGARIPEGGWDVVIVGAGYSGLWTAHYLLDHDPGLRVAIIEREFAGFGASGRNGGWCIGELAASYDKLAAAGDKAGALALMRAVFESVDEVGRVAVAAGFDCDFSKGGAVRLARTGAQLARQRAEVERMRSLGFTSDDVRLLGANEATSMMASPGVRGGLFFAHAAAVHPGKLVRGLAQSVVDRGTALFEHTAASSIEPGHVVTDHGIVRAPVVVRATEGYTRDLRGQKRALVPWYSLMIATEPLPDHVWNSIGLHDRQTFTDDRRLVIYGQRTADNRIAFGGRGAPYSFGSRIKPSVETSSAAHDLVVGSLRELLPQVADAKITHRWGGVLGIPRDWFPSVGFDRTTGLGHLGGYVGEGVAAANLAGRTLADLIVGADTERTTYPWVDHRSRRWEPEPFRWLGINAVLRAAAYADRSENKSDRPSRVGKITDRLLS